MANFTDDAIFYVDAIRLAMEGSDNDETRIEIIRELLDRAPHGEGKGDTTSVRIFLDAVKAKDGKFIVA